MDIIKPNFVYTFIIDKIYVAIESIFLRKFATELLNISLSSDSVMAGL